MHFHVRRKVVQRTVLAKNSVNIPDLFRLMRIWNREAKRKKVTIGRQEWLKKPEKNVNF